MPTPNTIIGRYPTTQQFDDFLQLIDRSGANVIGGIDGHGFRYGTLAAGNFVGVESKTANYTATSSDNGFLISFNSASPSTLTLPATAPTSPWQVWIQNTGAGTLTVNPNSLQMDGSTSTVSLTTGQGMMVASNGTAYFTERGVGGSGSTPSAFAGVNAQTTNYTALSGDLAKLVTFSSASAVTLTLPAVSPGTTWFIFVQNRGAGLLTISRNSLNIDGAAANLTLTQNQGVIIYSDGTNYFTERGIGGGSNSVNSQATDYTAVAADSGKLISVSKATAVTLTLPAASPGPTWFVAIQNTGAGALTVSRNGLNIDGAAANLTLTQNQGVVIYTDGTNYFTERGVTATGTTPASYLGWRNVMDYGAVGDGVTDDGPAIQAAINAAIGTGPGYTNGGGRVYFPRPSVNYKVDTTVVLEPSTISQLYLYGDAGPRSGGVDQFASAPRIRVEGSAQPLFRCNNQFGYGIFIKYENLDIVGLNGQGVWMTGVPFTRYYNCGFASNFDPTLKRSAGLIIDGQALWTKFSDCTFFTTDNNQGTFKPTLTVASVANAQANGYSVYTGTFPKGLFYGQQFALSAAANASAGHTVYTGQFPCGVAFRIQSVANASAGTTVYTGEIPGGAANAYAGVSFLIQNCTNSANNGVFVCSASSATTLSLSNASGVVETCGPNAISYHDATDAYVGMMFLIDGFTNAANNGAFVCTASTISTLTLTSATGVAETHSGTAYTGGVYTGMEFTIAGFTNGVNNGPFKCVAASSTKLVLNNSAAVAETHAATAASNATRDYDPSSWTPPACLIVCSDEVSGSILFDFEFCTMSFGGIKMQVQSPSASGETFGEILMNMCVLEGQFAGPMIQFENTSAEFSLGSGGITFARLTVHESQQADVAHPTPFVAVKGNFGRTASFGSALFEHCLSHSTAIVQGVGGNENITGILCDAPSTLQQIWDEESQVKLGSGFIGHSNAGWDSLGPVVGPASAYALTTTEGGFLRAGVSDPTTSSVSFMLDNNGDQYFGPGVSAAFDLKFNRSGVGTASLNSPVATPTAFAASAVAGGTFPDGTYYLKIAAGDRNNDPFLVSAASAEISVVCGGGNNTIQCTWVPSPTNPNNKYTIYVGTTPGGENKAGNVTSAGGPVTITAMPASNQTPNTVGTLLAPYFTATPSLFKHSFATSKFGTFTCPITADRTFTIPDASFTLAAKDFDNAFSTLQTFSSVKIGASGTQLTQTVVYTPTLTPSAVNANTTNEQAFTVNGITTADKLIINGPALGTGLGIVNVRASNTNQITIAFMNCTGSPATPASGVYTIIAVRS